MYCDDLNLDEQLGFYFDADSKTITALCEGYLRQRELLEKVLIKVDWNADEFHNAKQYYETRKLILAELEKDLAR